MYDPPSPSMSASVLTDWLSATLEQPLLLVYTGVFRMDIERPCKLRFGLVPPSAARRARHC